MRPRAIEIGVLKHYLLLLMYKRNQLIEAISVMTGGAASNNQVRRLLDFDRELPCNPRANDPEKANFAFFTDPPLGSGADVLFSDYEAFALHTAWQLHEHGFTQGSAVTIMRRARPQLEPAHRRILKNNRNKPATPERVKAGSVAVGVSDPVFLQVGSKRGRPYEQENDFTRTVGVITHPEAMKEMLKEPGPSWSLFELVSSAKALHHALSKTKPSKRGRARV